MLTRRWLACVSLGVLVVLCGVGTVTAGPTTADDVGVDQDDPLVPQTEGVPDPDATVTRVAVDPDGTAVWRLTIRMELDSNESVEGFGAFEEEFRANRSQYLGRFRDRMTGVVGNAEAVTDREMNATAFDAEVGIEEVPRRWGYVTYQFRWQGFAAVDDGVTVSDVFQGGLFLEADDVLIIESPPGYEPGTVDPTPDAADDTQLQWNGPRSFDDRRPQVQFVPVEPSGSGSGIPLLLVGSLAVVVLGLAAAYTLRRNGDDPLPAGGPVDGAAGESPAEAGSGSPGAEAGGPPELDSLATDEDRVVALLEAEDGRMRQADIADRLDWSASKTSRVVSEMAAQDTVEKLRIGRENVIDLVEDGDTDDA